MHNIDIWEKYKKIEKVGFRNYSNIYKMKNKKTGDYYAIKEIKKENFCNFRKCFKKNE